MENTTLFCAAVRDLAALYTDGQTSPQTTRAIQAHLLDCADCRRYYRDYRRSGAARTAAPAPDGVDSTATQAGYASLAQRLRRRTALARTLFILAAIAAGVAGFVLARWPREPRKK